MSAPNIDTAARAAWLESRRLGIGGSDVAALVGFSPYRTKLDVYADKVLDEPHADVDEDGPAAWGLALEGGLLQMVARKIGVAAYDHHGTKSFVDPERPWARCSPDAIALDGPVISLKTTVSYLLEEHGWGTPGTDEARDDAWAQLQWELGVLGRDEGVIACAVLDRREILVYPVKRDDAEIERMRGIASRFWFEHVVPRIPPELTDEEVARSGKALQRLYAKESGDVLDADQRLILLATAYKQLGKEMSEKKKQRIKIAANIQEVLAEAPGAQWGAPKKNARGLFKLENSIRWTTGKGKPPYKRVLDRVVDAMVELGCERPKVRALVDAIIADETKPVRKFSVNISGAVDDDAEED